MRIAILMTNTDDSPFSDQHPKDGEKFTALLHLARPDWKTQVFSVKDGIFPDDLNGFDGAIITGSPASVHDSDPWVAQLMDLIRQMVADGLPLFGACFGHQAIALALGGKVEQNPGGWVFGRTESQIAARADWMAGLPATLGLYAAHVEQVTQLPKGARILTTCAACPVGGFAIGHAVYTTQYHPEMTPDFIAALTDELADKLPPAVLTQARASLTAPADTVAFAESIARFFEQAVARD
ncbi:type 1 glutamine amidotransferase [Thalassovita taeanensis]|uniref:GMP synthase-Glutamine amidotransferase n=1 Tax=Thalassovita taeanensis TaxID=657014 RepID=A0A1H9DKQ5_9RHOB|nr:type 1 glutamine amidotransferase [Thalassovita taeanensis]SEQ14086.1 GMP synthase-Glutamine amidotransferase [Thalassovita taeanensis]